MAFDIIRRTDAVSEIAIPHGERLFRSFLVETGGDRILVDTGIGDTAGDFVETVRALKPDMVVITHAHGDHVGGLRALKAALPELPVACHVDEVERVESQAKVKVAVKLRDGDDLAAGIEAIHVPGHTPGNIALLVMPEGTLIAGDCVFGAEKGRRAELSLPPREYSLHPDEANANVQLLLEYDFDQALLSHGEHLLSNARGSIASLVEED